MTVIPVDEDHPDFTRPSQFTSAAILATTDTATSTPKVLATFYTGGYESMLVRTSGQAAGAGWVYTFKWFADQAKTVQLGQVNLRTLSAIPVNAQIPNRGPWCEASVATTTVGAKAFTIAVLPRTGTPSGAGAFLDGLVHGGAAINIVAGGNNVQNAFSLTPGEACMTVVTTAAVWSAKLFALDELSAAIGEFGAFTNTGGAGQTQRLILPTSWTQLAIHNGDGVLQTFDFSVQAAL